MFQTGNSDEESTVTAEGLVSCLTSSSGFTLTETVGLKTTMAAGPEVSVAAVASRLLSD